MTFRIPKNSGYPSGCTPGPLRCGSIAPGFSLNVTA